MRRLRRTYPDTDQWPLCVHPRPGASWPRALTTRTEPLSCCLDSPGLVPTPRAPCYAPPRSSIGSAILDHIGERVVAWPQECAAPVRRTVPNQRAAPAASHAGLATAQVPEAGMASTL